MEKKSEPAQSEKKPEPVPEEKKAAPAPPSKAEAKKEPEKSKVEEPKKAVPPVAHDDSSEKEKKDLREVDEKLEKLTAGIKIDKKPPIAQMATAKTGASSSQKQQEIDDYDQEHFEYQGFFDLSTEQNETQHKT